MARRRHSSSTAASEGKAVVRDHCFASAVVTSEKVTVNVRFSRKRSFEILENHENEGPLSAISGRGDSVEKQQQFRYADFQTRAAIMITWLYV